MACNYYEVWQDMYRLTTNRGVYSPALCSLIRDPKALPYRAPKPPHGLPHVPRLRRRVRRAEEQRPRLGAVVLGAEPRAAGDEDAPAYAGGEDLLFESEDAFVRAWVFRVV